jgi:hypothetical protein
MLLLSRVSRGLSEVHTSQAQATIGTPLLVPVPKNVIVNGGEVTLQTYRKMTILRKRKFSADIFMEALRKEFIF